MQNTIELHIGEWGNSLGIRLPKHISEVFHLKPNDKISCAIENCTLVLKPVRPLIKYTLKELLDNVVKPGKEISWGKSEGEEVW